MLAEHINGVTGGARHRPEFSGTGALTDQGEGIALLQLDQTTVETQIQISPVPSTHLTHPTIHPVQIS